MSVVFVPRERFQEQERVRVWCGVTMLLQICTEGRMSQVEFSGGEDGMHKRKEKWRLKTRGKKRTKERKKRRSDECELKKILLISLLLYLVANERIGSRFSLGQTPSSPPARLLYLWILFRGLLFSSSSAKCSVHGSPYAHTHVYSCSCSCACSRTHPFFHRFILD